MRKPLTPRAFRNMRGRRQEGALAIVNAIHDIGIREIHLESQTIGMEDYWLRAVIAQKELGTHELSALMEVCESNGANLSLRNDHDTGVRLVVWLPSA